MNEQRIREMHADLAPVLSKYLDNFPNGWCEATSRILHQLIAFGGDEREPVGLYEGEYGHEYHWWLQIGDVIIDPTAGQFTGGDSLQILDPHHSLYSLYNGERVTVYG